MTDRKEISTHLGTYGLLAAVVVCLLLTGCEFIGGFSVPTTTSKFERPNPLQISREKTKNFKSVLVAPPVDGWVYAADVVYFSEGLAKAGRFKVISTNELAKEASKEGVNLRLLTKEDKKLFFRKVGKKLSADAVLLLTGEEVNKYDPGMAELIGRSSMTGKIRLAAFSTDSGDVVWEQVQFLTITQGMFNRGTVEQHRAAQLDPLIAHFTSTFP